jgi:hypothetical protein
VRWDATEIARFARGAGFAGEHVTTATAVALATSGGNAAYDFRAGAPGAGHWVGLWGIDVDRWTELADHDLHVPQHAATAAYGLTSATGGWEWAGAHGTHYQTHYTEHAGAAQSRLLHHQQPAPAFTFHQTERAVAATIDRLAATRATLANYQSPGVRLWRPTTPSPTSGQ